MPQNSQPMKILDKLKDRIMPKTEAERQKLKKLVVFTLLSLSCLVCLWLIFLPDGDNDTGHGKANMELPDGSSDGISDTKREAYALDEAQKDKAAQDSTISVLETSLDTMAVAPAMTEQIQSSAEAYRQVQSSIQDFYVEDTGTDNVEMDALNERIAELESQNAMAQQQTQQSNDMAILERSYQLAAQYMGNGNSNAGYQAPTQAEEKGKRNVQPVAQVNRNVVSSLNASTNSQRLNTAIGSTKMVNKNTIAAVVAGIQSVIDGESVKLRTTEPMWVGNRLIPRNTIIVGSARVQGERLEIEITSIECQGSIYDVELQVYDSDGQEGINIPNSMESDALHEIGANMGSTMGSSINISTNTGAQIASDVGRGLINGVSQYLTKKMRTVKVHLKAGYRVMLHQPDND